MALALAGAVTLPAAAEDYSFDEIYSGYSAEGLTFSDKTMSLEGGEVTISGFMAPPLTPTIHFFVLTEVPMSVCPFCSSDADWPDNIIVVKEFTFYRTVFWSYLYFGFLIHTTVDCV